MEFYMTIMGVRYYEHTMPELIKNLDKISKELKRSNDLKIEELKEKEEV